MAELWPYFPLPDSFETLDALTDVVTTKTTEVRRSIRGPRQRLEYQYALSDARLAEMTERVRQAPLGEWYVPLWFEGTRVSDVVATSSTLLVDTNADYRAGGKLVIWSNCDEWTVADIAGVGSNSVNLSDLIGTNYPTAFVAPLVTAYLRSGVGYARLFEKQTLEGVSAASIVADVIDEPLDGSTDFDQYQGLDLVTKCGVIEPLSAGMTPPNAFVDGEAGFAAVEPTRAVVAERVTLSWATSGLSRIWTRKLWLYALRGRDRPFWLADWQRDLTLAADIAPSDDTILVEPVLPVLADYIGRHVLIDDGTKTPFEVTAAVDDGGRPRLTVGTVGRAITASNARLSFIRRVRLAADRLRISHVRGLVSRVRLPLVEVPA